MQRRRVQKSWASVTEEFAITLEGARAEIRKDASTLVILRRTVAFPSPPRAGTAVARRTVVV